MSSLVAKENFQEDRRRSILPTNTPIPFSSTSSNFKQDYDGLENSTGSFLLRRASSAANNFRRMSKVFRNEGPTKAFLRAAIGDPNRPKYMQLAIENDELHAEWKRLKGLVQSFNEEYEASKEAVILDPYRKYKRLCSMVKKLVLHLRLNDPSPYMSNYDGGKRDSLKNIRRFSCGQVLQSSVKERELRQKHSDIYDSLTTEELACKLEKLREKNAELQNRIDLVINSINDLSDSYEVCKRGSPLLRYYHLKKAVKSFIANDSLGL
ncbi:hypothetical protein Aperf_G00000110324 [Anoplocephala perfoliata]